MSAQHWDGRYESIGDESVGWFESRPTASLELFSSMGITPFESVIDVGGGASRLVDQLVAAGHEDVTVLDVSAVAIEKARRRLSDPEAVTWVVEDLLSWTPARVWDVWHDRALLHFLSSDEQRAGYLRVLRQALVPGGAVIISTFAEDGPTECSALPVRRHSLDDLSTFLGPEAKVMEARRIVHRTPGGVEQPFNWIAARL